MKPSLIRQLSMSLANNHHRYESSTSTVVEDEHSLEPITPISQDDYLYDHTKPSRRQTPAEEEFKDLFQTLNGDVDSRISRSFTDTDSIRPESPYGVISTHQNGSQKPLVATVDEEKAVPKPPMPVGFWHTGLAQTRGAVLRKYSMTLLILCVAIMGIL